MESKRQFQQEKDERGDQILVHHSKRRCEDSQQSETCRISRNYMSIRHTWNDMMPHLEVSARKIVREELERKLCPRPISNQTEISGAKFLQLVFKNELPDTIFTFSKIKAKDNTPLEVVLYNIKSQSIFAAVDDPLSSIKIEICVLNGEFGSNGSEDWSADEFNAKILRQRDNKGRLLKGDTVITLKNGVGYITNVVFTDNSSWMRSRRFRLGARVGQSNLKDAINIREGRSKPFIVKDARGELNQKHDPPSLKDEIWRLKHISKNGKIYKQLSSDGINTVEDLLKEHETNPSSLKETLHLIKRNNCVPYMIVANYLIRDHTVLQICCRPTNNQIGISGTKFLQLVFKNELPATIFTFKKIKAKDDASVEIALYDTNSRSIVADGSLSSIKVEICVLNGEFGSNGSEDWSADEFSTKILRQRDNKGQLLKGETVIELTNGVGYITNVEFTDNSSWMRSRRFRLGARVGQSNLKDAINIREGRSKPFIVKDARGESNQKHDRPSLKDEIWRLKHISKTGKIYEQLSLEGIYTVEDLLKEHETNPSSLKEKFGQIGRKQWEEIIKHAKTCVAEATFDGQNYDSEKNTLNSDERQAYKNLKDAVPIETGTHESAKTLTQATQYGAANQDLQRLYFPIAQQEEISRQMDPLNWSAEGQFVDGNIWPGDVSRIDQIVGCFTPPDINPLFFFNGNEAECSNHSSFPSSALYTSNKGKRKMV
ncbi:Calmodulin-binding protein 60 B [Spatholobus suberectus]|nr:Calmodulin-binding protein 60 B [Spatholobus suberectus]